MNDWLIRRTRRPDATHRLYCFPVAGGSPGEFLRWENDLPGVEVWGLLPPGRGKRLDEPPYTNASRLAHALVNAVTFRAPFLLFGHSLGALLAFETARALATAGPPGPVALIVSAHRPPHLPQVDRPVHTLPDPEFRSLVAQRYPAPPPELAEDPELLAQLYRTLRRDLEVFETYRYVPSRPLACPIIVTSGRDDHWSEADLAGWAEHTSAGCQVQLVDGDHFYLPERNQEILRIITGIVAGRGIAARTVRGPERSR